MVQRTTVVISEELSRRAKRAAAERGVSMGQLIREALEEKLRNQRPKAKSFGLGSSNTTARETIDLYEPDPWRS
jgi:hypothetical protein